MFSDGVMEGSSTLGTADYTLTGSVYNSRTFAQAFSDEQYVAFFVQTLDRSKWEMVIGTYDSGPPRKLRRGTIVYSSAAGAKVDWQPTDSYYIASIASADALAGVATWGHLNTNRPWWILFGQWVRQVFPTGTTHTWKFFDGIQDIDLGVIDTVTHKIQYAWAFPAGVVMAYAGAVAPTNFLLCRGQSLSRATYPLLFAAIGTQYGAVDGNSFTIPDMRARVAIGMDAAPLVNRIINNDVKALGNFAGVESVTATITINSAGTIVAGGLPTSGGSTSTQVNTQNGQATVSQSGHTHTVPSSDYALAVSGSGSSGSMETLPPFITLNYIISLGTT